MLAATERRRGDFLSSDLRSLYHFNKIKDIDLAAVSRLIVVDTRQPDRLDRLQECLRNPGLTIHLYDHHPGATVTIFTRISALVRRMSGNFFAGG